MTSYSSFFQFAMGGLITQWATFPHLPDAFGSGEGGALILSMDFIRNVDEPRTMKRNRFPVC